MQTKTKVLIPILALIILGSSMSMVISVSAFDPSYPQALHIRYVRITELGGRPHWRIRSIYKRSILNAVSFYEDRRMFPEGQIYQYSGSEDYWTFNTMLDFANWIAGYTGHSQYGWWSNCKGYVLIVEAENHWYDIWGNLFIQYGNGEGTVYNHDFKVFAFTREYRESGTVSLGRSDVMQLFKRQLAMGVGHGTCWLGWLFGGCIYEGFSRWSPHTTIFPCPLCLTALSNIAYGHGWW